MKVLVVGGGGREHAICQKLSESKKLTKLYCAPGNAGISEIAEIVPIGATDIEGIVNFSKENKIDLVVVSPDDPLVMGMVDALNKEGIRAFGPDKNAAIIEGSKVFSKELMKKYNIPTAKYEVFDNPQNALEYLKGAPYPAVIKAEGLARGKGVIIAKDYNEAQGAIKSIMVDKVFGASGNRVVIEEFLEGTEISVLAFTDGKTIIPMKSAQDHKRALDNDEGLNTGGMGAFSPSPIYTKEMEKECMEKIFIPTMEAMNKENRTFRGVLYFGLISTKDGVKVIEYNCRFGDPETQAVLPLFSGDLLEVFEAIIDGRLSEVKFSFKDEKSVCIVMASGGYPQKYETGYEIFGLDEAKSLGVSIYHAGTKHKDGKIVTSGGRVLGVCAQDKDFKRAIEKAYEGVKKISFTNCHFRTDIGKKYI